MKSPNLSEIVTTTQRNRSMGKEGSAQDKREDKKLAKQHGMTMEQWEKSPQDKAHDAPEAPVPSANHSFPQARAGAHGYGHGVERRQGHLRVSGHSGAHQIGKKR